jgi:hypothetical protein
MLLAYRIGSVRSGDDNAALAFIADNILFVHQIFCIIHPIFFPVLLLEIFELETWMKD